MSLTGLRRRGWTDALVRNLLGAPDLRRSGPHHRSGPPMRLYTLVRVERAEPGEEFAAAGGTAARRAAAARAAAERRRQAVLATVRAEPVHVPPLEARELAEQAVRHRNALDEERTHDRADRIPDPATTEDVGPAAPARWQVNRLRHALTRYDTLLNGLFGATGRAEAELLLRRRVYRSSRPSSSFITRQREVGKGSLLGVQEFLNGNQPCGGCQRVVDPAVPGAARAVARELRLAF
ncbi:hypothetical protein [Streptomyces sp. NPDC051286]|uniref:hypothetical protein n=1 Tax=Streptomyces sp. NPDC051286 TaxID=3365647 RepID=UPI0037BCCF7A